MEYLNEKRKWGMGMGREMYFMYRKRELIQRDFSIALVVSRHFFFFVMLFYFFFIFYFSYTLLFCFRLACSFCLE